MADADQDLHLAQKWVVTLKGCKAWVPKQKTVNETSFLALSKWDRQAVLALTGKALDLRKNRDGGSLNSDVWDGLLAARQEVADKAIEEAFQTEDHEAPAGKKRKAVTRASSKHDFMAPPILTLQFRGYSFRVLYEGLGSHTLWVEACEETLRKLKEFISDSKPQPRQPKARAKKSPKKSPMKKQKRRLQKSDSN